MLFKYHTFTVWALTLRLESPFISLDGVRKLDSDVSRFCPRLSVLDYPTHSYVRLPAHWSLGGGDSSLPIPQVWHEEDHRAAGGISHLRSKARMSLRNL